MILKMPAYRLKSAYLPQGWTRDVVISVSDQGLISGIELGPFPPSGAAGIELIEGVVVPGMPNAHSHAFQRAIAGAAEYSTSGRDSFWTWREAMYSLANRIEPEDLKIIATQLFIEMLKAGYTSVAEFHYLHHPLAMWEAIGAAADEAGIGLTLLPTLYQSSDFGARPLRAEQARFAMDVDSFLRAIQDYSGRHRIGAAFHSLRAVPLENLNRAAHALRTIDESMPVHIHIAEQMLEVRSCLESTGRRPIELLLDQGLITARWCLVHATHAAPSELKAVAGSGAAVCVSISTEANLGDGFFDGAGFLKAGGRLCIGSDSQATVSPTEELRWLEYQQRLKKRRRGVLATKTVAHVGTRLWNEAAHTGAQALGIDAGRIAVGARADWLVLDPAHPTLVGGGNEAALDHLVFAGADAAIRHVMVAGRWVVKDRHHAAEDESGRRFAKLMLTSS